MKPLQQAQTRLTKERAEAEAEILRRAEANSAEYEASWTREPIERKRTVEIVSPIDAQMVRLVVEGTEANPSGRSGYHIDEFEVWTDGPEPRNVAAAASGGRAEGASRVAQDFADAYSADLQPANTPHSDVVQTFELDDVQVSIPEPTSAAFLAVGLFALGGRRGRRSMSTRDRTAGSRQ